MCTNPEPMWQRYITKPQTPRFSSHTSLFWTLPEQLGTDDTTHVCQPWTYTTKPQTLRCSSHTSVLNFAGTAPMLHHTCEPTHPEPTSQDTLQISDPKIFISHIPVLNFAGTARHVTPRMWANPSCTNVPRSPQTTNESILQTHPHPNSQDTPLKISMFTV